MKIRYLGLTAVCCTILYLASFAVAAWRVHTVVKNYSELAREEFDHMVEATSAAAALGFLDEGFVGTVRDSVERSHTLAAAIVSGPNGPEYAIERESGFLDKSRETPRFVRRFDTANETLFAPIKNGPVRNATISASFLRFDRAELFPIFRDTLILIVVTLLIAALILFANSVLGEEPHEEETSVPPPQPVPEPYHGPEDEFEIPELAPDIKIDEQPESAPPMDEAAPTERIPKTPVDLPRTLPMETAMPETAGEPERTQESTPSGLYSPESGIGWQEYTQDRLSSELRRCASFEQDLVLMVMQPKHDSPEWRSVFPEFAEEAVSFFTFRDMLFERDQRGISVILPNIDLEHGLRMADEFLGKMRKINGRLPLVIEKADLRIGLSARSGRLIDTNRLILESNHALAKAIEDASPIIAFKSDPERYRNYLADNS